MHLWPGRPCGGKASWVPCDRTMVSCTELSNVEFHCGRAEDLVPALVNRLASQQLIAILDPPRAGLRKWPPLEPYGEEGGRDVWVAHQATQPWA